MERRLPRPLPASNAAPLPALWPGRTARIRPALTSAALCLALAACGERAPAPAAAPAAPVAPPTDTASPVPPTTPAANAANAAAEPAAPPYRFAFASKGDPSSDKRRKDPRVVEWGEDGCGAYPVARVDAIPLRDAWLRPDWVVEFDDKDREIQRWGRPMAAELTGLDGARLGFRVDAHGQRGEFATTPDGALQALPGQAASASLYASARQIECPALPTFAESDYVQCFVVKDAAGGERRLAWEAPCT